MIIIAWPIIAGSAAWGAAAPDFYSHYWIEGTVSADALPAAGREVDFYYKDSGKKISAYTDASGRYRLNAYDLQYFFGVPLTYESVSYNVAVKQTPGETSGFTSNPLLKAIQGYIDQFFAILHGQQVRPKLIYKWPTLADSPSTSPTVKLIFSETMEATTIPRAVTLPQLKNASWQMLTSSDKTTFYFTPGAFLVYGLQYKVTVSQAASDESGNPLDDSYGFYFKPGHSVPYVSGNNPVNGATDVPRRPNVWIVFSEGMNRASVIQALNLPDQGGPWVPSWGTTPGTSNTLHLTPHDALVGDTDYMFSISSAAKSLSNEALSPVFTMTFHTTNEIGPEVIDVTAGNDVLPTSPIWAVFSEPIDPSTLPANMDVKDSSGKAVPGSFRWDSSTSTANFIPASPLLSLQEYTVNIRNGITDLSGLHLKNPVTSMLIIADTTGPEVKHVWFDGRGFVDNDVISPSALITAEISDPSGLDYSAMAMSFGNVMTVDKSGFFGASDTYSGNRLSYGISPPLPEGSYVLTIEAYDLRGNMSTWNGRVRVFSGETQIVPGTIPFVSPASISPLKTSAAGAPAQATMVYQLTMPGNIDLQIQGISGMVWARRYAANKMGGLAGYNAVAWDGKDNSGNATANGVYTFRIINNGRLLGKGYIIVYE